MVKPVIAKAEISDATLLARAGRELFSETYSPTNKPEHVLFYSSKHYADDVILKELSNPKLVTFIARDKNGKFAGYVSLSLKSEEANSLVEVRRLYFYKEYHGSGMAKHMLEYVEKFAKKNGFEGLKLFVWSKNFRAIAFYEKSGFENVGDTTFDWECGQIDDDFIMVKKFR
jgi:ribosomal protein S18 acetylase RimI-like enzyme